MMGYWNVFASSDVNRIIFILKSIYLEGKLSICILENIIPRFFLS